MGIQWNLNVVLICICLISRNIILPTKVCLVKAMVVPVVMYECESWTIKKAEHWRIDAFKLWCWRRLLRVPSTARRSHESILKEINPEYSLDGLMLKLQYFGHLMQRASSLEKTLMLGKIEGRRKRGKQRMRWLDDITDSVDMNLSKQGSLTGCSPRGCRVGHDSDWTIVANDADRLFMGGHYSTLGGCPVVWGSCNEVWTCLSRHLDLRCRLQRFQYAKIIFYPSFLGRNLTAVPVPPVTQTLSQPPNLIGFFSWDYLPSIYLSSDEVQFKSFAHFLFGWFFIEFWESLVCSGYIFCQICNLHIFFPRLYCVFLFTSNWLPQSTSFKFWWSLIYQLFFDHALGVMYKNSI